jgi:hypothetical protein
VMNARRASGQAHARTAVNPPIMIATA